jgi:hypothetical protein
MSTFSINERFNLLNDLAKMVVYDVTPSLIVTGEGGLGKTHQIKEVIDVTGLQGCEYIFIKGYSTARGLYNTLYDNNDKLIIFDDCDSVLEDKVAVNILKSALDSYDNRTISWMAKMNKNDKYPQQFDFIGRIIFISNKSKDSIDGAILSRSLTVDLTMTPAEKIERMTTILPGILPEYDDEVKVEALNFLNENKDGVNINMRTLIMVIKMANSNPDNWKSMAGYMLNS